MKFQSLSYAGSPFHFAPMSRPKKGSRNHSLTKIHRKIPQNIPKNSAIASPTTVVVLVSPCQENSWPSHDRPTKINRGEMHAWIRVCKVVS